MKLEEAEVRGLSQLVVNLYTGDTTLEEAREIIAAVTRLGDSWLTQREALEEIETLAANNAEEVGWQTEVHSIACRALAGGVA